MKFEDAQKDMDQSYYGGWTGVLVSGVVWCIAATVALISTEKNSMLTLFFGGMLIHPLSVLFDKALKRSGSHDPKNPLGALAMEGTVILFVGLFLAFMISKFKMEWFYPIMLLAIGVRYLTFNTLYGNKTYWILGLVLMMSGVYCIWYNANFILGAWMGGVTEVVFAFVIFHQAKRNR